MCLAIYKPANVSVPKQHLENGYEQNDHGAGIAWFENGQVKVLKGFFSFKKFYVEYEKRKDFPMLIHFRWATHGDKNSLNCHPFTFSDNRYALIHNGVLPIKCMDKNLSDTGNFAKLVMEPIMSHVDSQFLGKPAFRFLVEQAIGEHNKIVVMGPEGKVVIFNEESGVWEGDKGKEIWYSNEGFRYTQSDMEELMAKYQATKARRTETADSSTVGGVGFAAGTNQCGANGHDKNKGKLDQPPVIDLSAPKKTNKNLPSQIILNGKTVDMKDTQALPTIAQGPIFDPKVELEIAHVMRELHLARTEAVEYLDLDDQNCEGYVG